ncbi:MAG: hypothetical protein J4431_04485 [Candidatus Aenigmarchaeota archaeon]|nr:hypothetical protein [Candidatus Aenigmarchaeota archaeon]
MKVLFDDGGKIRVLRGTLVNFDPEVLVLQTLNKDFYIRRASIIKIHEAGDENNA